MKKSLLTLFVVLLHQCMVAQTWSKKLDWVPHYTYLHDDSCVGVKDAAFLLNGNICALTQMDQDENTKLLVLDSASHQILWYKDVGHWGALASQFSTTITATSDSALLLCTNWYSQATDLHISGLVYKYSPTGTILWTDTFIAAQFQMRTAADIAENSNGDYLALVGDTVYVLDAATGNINSMIPVSSSISLSLGNSFAIHIVPGSTDFIVNAQNSSARFDLAGNIVWLLNHSNLQFAMHSAITPNGFYLLQNDTLNTIDLSSGTVTNTTILPATGYFSSLNPSANGNLFASQGQTVHHFDVGSVQSGGIVKIDPAGNVLSVKSIPLPLCGLSWVSELPGGMLFCGGGYRITSLEPSVGALGNNYMPFCFTTDSAMNGVMDSTTYMWPGDANNNHNLQFSDDALYIQQSMGRTGIIRDTIHYFSPYNGLDHSDFVQDWSTTNTAGVNDKFGDVNGDGTIDVNDLNAFNTVWFSNPINVTYRTAFLPDLTFVPLSNLVLPGDTAKFYIIAGLTTPIDSVSGIAFSNSGFLSAEYISVDFLPNNLGIPQVDTRTFCSPPSTMNFGNVVLSRIDLQNKHLSNDTLGIINFVIPTGYTDTTFSTSVTGIQAITGDGSNVPVVAVNGTVTVSGSISVPDLQIQEISLFPNPANNNIEIGSQYAQQNVLIYNSIGKNVMKTSVSANGSIEISTLAHGVYYLKLADKDLCRKFVVCR